MVRLAIPIVESVEASETFGRFRVEPLEKGVGVTLGNALRRMLFSSLAGAAVTWVKIEGVQHEFSTIPHMKEDTTEFLLNIKGLRLKALSGREGRLMLEVAGERDVCAADIQSTDDFEITNPELYLATLDSPDAKLTVELNVEIGKGYQEAGSDGSLPVGAIPVDAIFTPVRRVNFITEPMHIGRETSRERLYLEVWTDGTISPADAVSSSARLLVELLSPFVSYAGVTEAGAEPEVTTPVLDEKYNKTIEELDLSVRTLNALRRAGIATVGELITKEEKELLSLRNFGQKSKQEVVERIALMGLSLVSSAGPAETEEDEVEAAE